MEVTLAGDVAELVAEQKRARVRPSCSSSCCYCCTCRRQVLCGAQVSMCYPPKIVRNAAVATLCPGESSTRNKAVYW